MIGEWYLWIRAVHVMAVISWMAGLFYLPRLFVYHTDARTAETRETFKIMERRLYRAIMWPAMVAAHVLGWLMAFEIGFTHGWLHVKILMIALLTAYHFWLGTYVKRFAAEAAVPDARFFRMINEIPTLLMIVIVIMVVVKPF